MSSGTREEQRDAEVDREWEFVDWLGFVVAISTVLAIIGLTVGSAVNGDDGDRDPIVVVESP